MENVILVIHLFLALAIIGLVLMQRSEGGGLGIGGGSGAGDLATPRGTASFLTRATAICAVAFFTTSLVLGIMAGTHTNSTGILEEIENTPAIEGEMNNEGEIPENESGEFPSAPIAE
ncbi:MAG: preprotein translocase subunit SecG [Alphaproteobacteria bacterium]